MPPKVRRIRADDPGAKDALLFKRLAMEMKEEEKEKVRVQQAQDRKTTEKESAKEALREEFDPWIMGMCAIALLFIATALNDSDYLGALFIFAGNAIFMLTSMSRNWFDVPVAFLTNICMILVTPHLRNLHRTGALLPWSSWALALPFNGIASPLIYFSFVDDKKEVRTS